MVRLKRHVKRPLFRNPSYQIKALDDIVEFANVITAVRIHRIIGFDAHAIDSDKQLLRDA
jgi:hypothetical protein